MTTPLAYIDVGKDIMKNKGSDQRYQNSNTFQKCFYWQNHIFFEIFKELKEELESYHRSKKHSVASKTNW